MKSAAKVAATHFKAFARKCRVPVLLAMIVLGLAGGCDRLTSESGALLLHKETALKGSQGLPAEPCCRFPGW
jgi:hypothetical protein